MDKNSRKICIAGNWKMNKTPDETKKFLKELIPKVEGSACDVVCCVPFVDLDAAIETAKDSNLKIGAQNCHWEESGAYTGEISAKMLKETGTQYVIVGHSERRAYFGDSDNTVNKRAKAALKEGLNVIICVGEDLEQREKGITEDLISMQIKLALKDVYLDEMKKVIIAYEPVWAIGTGKTATAQQANEVCSHIRKTIEKLYDKEVAENIVIQYGGSMKPQNAKELLSMPDIDGGLIGGAALKTDDFANIVNIVQ